MIPRILRRPVKLTWRAVRHEQIHVREPWAEIAKRLRKAS